jgi:hypothetical protein
MSLTIFLFIIIVFVSACLIELRPIRTHVVVDAVILPMAPRIVTVGEDFLIIVKTSNCTQHPEDIDITIAGLIAEITPYQRLDRSGSPRVALAPVDCLFRRIVTLRFTSPGLATVRVIGLNQVGERTKVETHVQVRPQ